MAFVDRLMIKGDRVIMNMDMESRGHLGDKYPPDGTLGTFQGCSRILRYRGRTGSDRYFYEPGIYEVDGVAIIEWDNGSTAVDGWSHHMEDTNEYNRRFKAYHETKHTAGSDENAVRLGDLPETKFWEGDIVKAIIPFSHELNRLRVSSIQWHWDKDARGWCYHVEWVNEDNSYARMGSTYLHDVELELIERGNVWREAHGEELNFNDFSEKVSFEKLMGRYKEVRNPASNLYSWSKDEVLKAIKDGIVDGFSMPNGLFGGDPKIQAVRLTNREIGEQLRKETINGFGLI